MKAAVDALGTLAIGEDASAVERYHVHLIAAVPNGDVVEYMPWTAGLFEDPPRPLKSEMTVPTAPGLGLRFARRIEQGFARV